MFEGLTIDEFPIKYYFPVLRGLRPIGKDAYKERTIKDYFSNDKTVNIITGYDLYELLKKYLLGLPDDRDRVRSYEGKLGDVFFEGQKTTLVPEYSTDTVSVKIGDDPQFPIYDLGDGLQQVIIFTSSTFLNKIPSIYFIEEPEVHLHPGLLRTLINFLADETPHQYIFTTHSNHLFDLVNDRNDVIINKVAKKIEDHKNIFEISEVSKDKRLLLELGVKPSSVYLSNCTIWIEGISDRFYIRAFLKKYLEILKIENFELYQKYVHYTENCHYSFVEYQGGVLTHWNFDDFNPDGGEISGLSALSVCSEAFLIADGDIRNKGERETILTEQLGERLYIIQAKEIENYLPEIIIHKTVEKQFKIKRKNKDGIDISKIKSLTENDYSKSMDGIGQLIDNKLEVPTGIHLFSEESGTIKDKVNFCLIAVEIMSSQKWDMPEYLKDFCSIIYSHINKNNLP